MSKRRKHTRGNPRQVKSRRKPKRSPIHNLAIAILTWNGWYWVAVLLGVFVGAMLTFLVLPTGFLFLFGKFLPQDQWSAPWLVTFLVTSVGSLVVFQRRGWFRHMVMYPFKGRFSRMRQGFFGGLSVITLNFLLIFMVTPWLLHQAIAESSRVVVTVTDVDPCGGYRTCRPEVSVDLYGGAWFLITDTFFRHVERGDQLILEGRQSPLGMSVYQYSILTPDPVCQDQMPGKACPAIPIWR